MQKEMGERREPEKKGVIFLIYKDGKVLLEDRTLPGKTYFGYKIIPGGKFEAGKDGNFEETAKREAEEETGITVREIFYLDSFLAVSPSNHLYELAAFLITKYDGEVQNSENKSGHLWVDLDNAADSISFVDGKYVILLARNFLNGVLRKGD